VPPRPLLSANAEDAIIMVERVRARLVARSHELTTRKPRGPSDAVLAHVLSDVAAVLNAECIGAREELKGAAERKGK
jgi:hypothetical protein